MKVVLDANLFVSAAIEAQGNPARILNAWRNDLFDLLLSEEIIREIKDVLGRPRIRKRHRWSEEQIVRFLDALRELATMTPGRLQVEAVSDDPDDNIYLACGIEGEADYIVSGDAHLRRVALYQGIPIVSPIQFLAVLADVEPHV